MCPDDSVFLSVTQWMVSLFISEVYSFLCAPESIFLRTLILQISFFFASLCIIKFSATASFLWAFQTLLNITQLQKSKTNKQTKPFPYPVLSLLATVLFFFPIQQNFLKDLYTQTASIFLPELTPSWLVSTSLWGQFWLTLQKTSLKLTVNLISESLSSSRYSWYSWLHPHWNAFMIIPLTTLVSLLFSVFCWIP